MCESERQTLDGVMGVSACVVDRFVGVVWHWWDVALPSPYLRSREWILTPFGWILPTWTRHFWNPFGLARPVIHPSEMALSGSSTSLGQCWGITGCNVTVGTFRTTCVWVWVHLSLVWLVACNEQGLSGWQVPQCNKTLRCEREAVRESRLQFKVTPRREYKSVVFKKSSLGTQAT